MHTQHISVACNECVHSRKFADLKHNIKCKMVKLNRQQNHYQYCQNHNSQEIGDPLTVGRDVGRAVERFEYRWEYGGNIPVGQCRWDIGGLKSRTLVIKDLVGAENRGVNKLIPSELPVSEVCNTISAIS